MKRWIIILAVGFISTEDLFAQGNTPQRELDWARGFATMIMRTYPDSIVVKKFVQHMMQDKEGNDPSKRTAVWNYEEAVALKGTIGPLISLFLEMEKYLKK